MPVLVIFIVLTNIKRIGNPIMNLDSLNSASASSNSICILSTSCLASLNWSSNIFFSSLHTTLMHFGGWCCLGCCPSKCGWARALVEWALFVRCFGPKISDMTSSSCSSPFLFLLMTLCLFLFSFPEQVLWGTGTCLFFFPKGVRVKNKPKHSDYLPDNRLQKFENM